MQHTDHKILKASLLVALSGLLYGFLGFFGTTVVRDNIPIETMLFWRFLVAGCWMLLFALRKHSFTTLCTGLSRRLLFFVLLLGAIGYAGSSEFYFIASHHTSTGLAMVIFFSYPLMVALLSWVMFKQPPTRFTWLLLLVMMGGMYLLRDPAAAEINVIGIITGVIAAACYAFYIVGSKAMASIKLDSMILTLLVSIACTLVFLVVAPMSGDFVVPSSLQSWLSILALGILATALPIQLMLEGLNYISSMRASIISVIEPLVTIIVGVLLLEETVSPLQLVGTFIILSSALLVQFQREL